MFLLVRLEITPLLKKKIYIYLHTASQKLEWASFLKLHYCIQIHPQEENLYLLKFIYIKKQPN